VGTRESVARQEAHYERIHDAYEAHYYDPTAIAYRERFFLDPLLAGLDLDGRRVVELASGSGHNSIALRTRFPTVELTGLDISPRAIQAYQEIVGRPAVQFDLVADTWEGDRFDAGLVIGGLHHCVQDLRATLRNAARLITPGGYLMMMEPSRDFGLESVRRWWYRRDSYFDAETEEALSHDALLALASEDFVPDRVHHMGGPAYFLILNSLVFRMPAAWKRPLAPPLMALEALYNRIPGRRLFPYFVARWRRRTGDT